MFLYNCGTFCQFLLWCYVKLDQLPKGILIRKTLDFVGAAKFFYRLDTRPVTNTKNCLTGVSVSLLCLSNFTWRLKCFYCIVLYCIVTVGKTCRRHASNCFRTFILKTINCYKSHRRCINFNVLHIKLFTQYVSTV